MAKLTYYEIFKLFKYKFVLLLLLISTMLMAFLLTDSLKFGEFVWARLDRESYESYVDATKDMSYEEAEQWIRAKSYEESRLLAEFKLMQYATKPAILLMIKIRYKYIASYHGTIEAILKQANLITTSEFYAENKFALSDAKKVLKDYSKLADISPSRDAALYVEAVAAFDTIDYVLLFQIMVIAILLFGTEDNNIKGLLRSQNKGRGHVFSAKLMALMCASAVLVLITYLYFMIVGFIYYNGGALDVPIQSFESFVKSKYIITAKELMIMLPVLKVFGAWIFAFLFSLCITVGGVITGTVLSGFFTSIAYAAYFLIDGRSLLSPFKYVNPAAWFDVNGWMSEYANINFFTKAISFETGFIIGGVLLSVVLVTSSWHFYVSENNRRLSIPMCVTGLTKKMHEKITAAAGTSLLFHETHRLYIENYKWLFVVAFIAASTLLANDKSLNINLSRADTYNYYLDSIESVYSEETIEYLRKYLFYLMEMDGYRESLESDYADGTISYEEYWSSISNLKTDIRTLESFMILYNQGQVLKIQDESGTKNLGFINKKWTDSIFESGNRMVLLELLTVVCMMFVVLGSYLTSDYKVFNLIKSTYKGRWDNNWIKVLWIFILSTISMLPFVLYYSEAIDYLNNKDALDFGLRSIDLYSKSNMDITIREMLIYSMFFKFVGIVLIGFYMFFLSLWHIPEAVFQIIVLFSVLMPPLLELMSGQTNIVIFSGFFYMEQLFKGGMVKTSAYIVVTFVFMTIFGFVSLRHYSGNKHIGG